MTVKNITNATEFDTQLKLSDTLVVIDFTASWCGPCKRMAPVFEELAVTYSEAVFLKVDIDVCQETALSQGISSVPCFVFYKNGTKIDSVVGANRQLLEEKLKLHSSESPVKGHFDLTPFINKSESGVALNEDDDHPLSHCLQDDESYLSSANDNQLIIPITFSQAVKIHSIKLKAPEKTGPKTIKLFTNQPNVLDFDDAARYVPTQAIDVSPEDLSAGKPIPLQFVKFQNVQNLQIFVEENHDGSDITRIDHLQLFGMPVATTNMEKFKRVTGKIGEAH